LFVAVAIALFRGRAHWDQASPIIWLHLATVLTPLMLTPVQLLRRRGDGLHRMLGWVWAVLMFATAAVSFGIRGEDGSFSLIHIFSVITVITVPLMVFAARNHRVAAHRRAVLSIITGALLIAGYFTLIPGRLLGGWLWG
jgi:uncharacterized membrane protein